MMKKSFFFAGLAAALCLVGCNKETDLAGNGRKVEIVLSDAQTRTVNNGLSTKWEAEDALNVFVAPAGTDTYSSNAQFVVDNPETNNATGTVDLSAATAYDWFVSYPYDKHITTPASTETGYMTIGSTSTGVQTQAGLDSKAHLAGTTLPVYGVAKNVVVTATPEVSMKHMASVIAVNLTNDTDKPLAVSTVSFTAPEDIVGTYYVDFTGDELALVGSGANYVSKTATLSVTGDETIAAGASAKFYIAIKPFAAKVNDELTLSVIADQGEVEKTVKLTQASTFASGSIKTLNLSYQAPVVVPTITVADIKEAITSTTKSNPDSFTGQLAGAVVSFVSGSNAFIQDETGGILLYLNGHGLKAGDVLSGIVSGTGYVYNGLKEMISLTGFDKVGGEAPEAVSLSLEQLLADYDAYVSVRVKVTGVTVPAAFTNRNTTMTDGDASLALRDQKNGLTITPGMYDITGYPSYFNAAQFGVWTQDDIVSAGSVNIFDVTPQQIDVAATATSTQITVSGNVEWTAEASEGVTIDKVSGTGSDVITVSFAANTTPEPKEYTVFVRSTAAGVNDEFEVNITQAAASTEAKAYPFNESFATDQGDFTIENVSLGDGLSNVWSQAKYNSDTYMKASAYVSGKNIASESWLISPVVDMARATAPVLSFRHCVSKFFGDVSQEATVWIKEEGGSWNQLTVTYPTVTSGNFSSFEGVSVDVTAYAGKKVQVGFKYISTSEHAGTWEVTDVKLDEAVTGPVDPTFTAPETLFVEVGKTAKINVTTNSDGAVTFASSDTAVATVAEDGTVTGVAAGTANVTVSAAATANFNAASATVAVTVTEVDNTLHTIVVADYASTSFTAGVYSFTAAQDEAATAPAYNANGRDLRIYAKGTLTVSNSKENMTKIVFNLSTQGLKRLAPITASTGTIATQAANDTKVTWTGDASSVVFTVGDKAIFGSDGDAANGQLCFTTVDVSPWSDGDVQPKTLSSIEVSGQKTTFTVGDEFVFGGTVTAVYSDGSRSTVDESDVTISGYDMSTAGEQTVSVTYQTKSTEYVIIVNAKPDVSGESWAAVPTLSDLAAGTYVITALSSDKYYAVPSTTINGQTFTCVEGIYNSTDKTFSPAEGSGEFVLTAGPVENSYYIYNPTLEKYLVATGSKKFGYVDNTSSDYGYWTFSEVTSGGFSGVFSVKHDNKSHYMRAYNNTVRCYDGTNNSGVYFFKK